MTTENRPTPLTDDIERDYFSILTNTIEVFDHARQLEQMMHELAEHLNNLHNAYDPYAVPGGDENINMSNEAEKVLTRHNNLMKGVKHEHDNG